MKQDPELAAMTQVAQALGRLDQGAVSRVLKWAAERFNAGKVAVSDGKNEEVGNDSKPIDFTDLPTLYDAANPSTDADKALVVGYWLQVINNEEFFESQDVNAKLKNLGHGVGNITRAFDALKSSTPTLVHQVEKSGTTKQARKKYKLTVEGARKVKAMIQQKVGR